MQRLRTSAIGVFRSCHFIYSATNLHDDTYFFMRVWHSGLKSIRFPSNFFRVHALRFGFAFAWRLCLDILDGQFYRIQVSLY